MFNNNQSNSMSLKTPPANRMACIYCKKPMMQIAKGYVDTFICINCGGRCVIEVDEAEIKSKREGWSFQITQATGVKWSKVKVDVSTRKK